jgi:perosamine synthetase
LSILSDKLELPLAKTNYCKNIFWVYGLVIKDHIKIKADFIINILRDKNIECRPFFYPMHNQPVYKKMKIFAKEKYLNSERISQKGFYIPCGLGITIKEQNDVIKNIINVFKKIN